jgi:phosphopantetheine adenylyltransferase
MNNGKKICANQRGWICSGSATQLKADVIIIKRAHSIVVIIIIIILSNTNKIMGHLRSTAQKINIKKAHTTSLTAPKISSMVPITVLFSKNTGALNFGMRSDVL